MGQIKDAKVGSGSGLRSSRAKTCIENVFHLLGGIEAMTAWARENPTDFYTKVWVKLLPLQVKASMTHTLKRDPMSLSDAELANIISRGSETPAIEAESAGKPH